MRNPKLKIIGRLAKPLTEAKIAALLKRMHTSLETSGCSIGAAQEITGLLLMHTVLEEHGTDLQACAARMREICEDLAQRFEGKPGDGKGVIVESRPRLVLPPGSSH